MSGTTSDQVLDPCDGFLAQGDLFTRVPIVELALGQEISAEIIHSPALLLNHGCALDKQAGGQPSIERLTFTRLRSTQTLTTQAAGSLRGARARVQPYEALYLGSVAEFGEAFVLLSDPFTVPAHYFALTLREFASDDRMETSVVAQQNDTRFARLNAGQRALLNDKWNAYWTRRLPAN